MRLEEIVAERARPDEGPARTLDAVEPGAERLEPGSYLVRQVIGFEEDANAFAIPDTAKPGDRIALVVREPEQAREDLKAMLAGLGSAPIAHAAATTKNPVRQGMIAMLGTFIDTIIVCSITGLAIISSGAWTSGETGAALTSAAFEASLPGVGHYFLDVSEVTTADLEGEPESGPDFERCHYPDHPLFGSDKCSDLVGLQFTDDEAFQHSIVEPGSICGRRFKPSGDGSPRHSLDPGH